MEPSQRSQAEQGAEHMARLRGVTTALGGAFTPEHVIRIIMEHVIEALGGHVGGLGLLNAEQATVAVVNYPEVADERLQPLFHVSISESMPMTDAIRTGDAIWVESVADYRARYPQFFNSVQPITLTKAGFCLPLAVQERVIGGLSVTFLDERQFSAADRQFMLTLAQQCALALDRARLYEAEKQARLEAEAEVARSARLLEVTRVLSQTLAFDHVARLIIDEGVQMLGATTGALNLLVDDERFEVLYAVGSQTPQAERSQWLSFPADPALPVTDAVRRREAIWFENSEEALARYPAIANLVEHYPGAWAILPLVIGDRVLGSMNYAFPQSRHFDTAERSFMVSLSYLCAQALERARLHQAAQETATLHERQRIARELHDAVSQTLFSASMIAEALLRSGQRQGYEGLEHLQLLHKLTRGAAAEMRELLVELLPESMVNTKLGDLLTRLAHSTEGRTSIKISVILKGSDQLLPASVQLAFYRIAQESINNIIKHGEATRSRIRFTRTAEWATLVVMDNGQGFDMQNPSQGLGLSTMDQRAASIGAELLIRSGIGRGTWIKLKWKVNDE